MGDVISFPPTTDEYFGGCPHCGGSDGYLNVYKNHWGVCDRHRVKWEIGYNLFSGWQCESEDDWRRHSQLLAGYKQVKPIYSRPDPCDEPVYPRPLPCDDLDDGLPF